MRTYELHLHILDSGWKLALLEDDIEKRREVCSSFREALTKGANWSQMVVTHIRVDAEGMPSSESQLLPYSLRFDLGTLGRTPTVPKPAFPPSYSD